MLSPAIIDLIDKASIPLALALFFAQSTTMWLLAARKITLGRWRGFSFAWRLLSFGLAGTGLLLPSLQDSEPLRRASELLLLGGLANGLIAVFQGIRVHMAIRRAIKHHEESQGAETPPSP